MVSMGFSGWGSLRGASLGPLGRPWGRLGAAWAVLGGFGWLVGRPKWFVGVSWVALELPLGRSWLYLAPLSLHLAPPGPLRGPFWAEIGKTRVFFSFGFLGLLWAH